MKPQHNDSLTLYYINNYKISFDKSVKNNK